MDADFLEHGPDPRLFNEWLSATFLGNNRTKTITTEKYDNICRYMMGDARSTNAKFRYWVKSKGFYLVSCEDASIGHTYQENELLIKHRPTVNATKRARSTKCESRLRDLVRNPRKAFGYRKVAVVEDFYEIIKAVHVDKFGEHVGQKLTYRIISCIYAFLPREVVTRYLVNCAVCKPRMEKFGNGSKNCRSRIFGCANFDLHSENDVDIKRLENETTLPEAELNSSGSENRISESESEEKDCAIVETHSDFIMSDQEDIYESEIGKKRPGRAKGTGIHENVVKEEQHKSTRNYFKPLFQANKQDNAKCI